MCPRFDVHTFLLFHHYFEIKKMLKHFTFVFHEVDPHLPCVVINFVSRLTSIGGLQTKLWASKVVKVPILGALARPSTPIML
jgi:hypothetical protein